MSRAKKHVTEGYTSELVLPLESQSIVRVFDLRGGNVCEVEYPNGDKILALIPAKFKNVLWIRKGSFAIVDMEAEQLYAGKVRTTIVHLLSPDHIKDLKKLDKWPSAFLTESEKKHSSDNIAKDNKTSDGVHDVGDDEEQEESDDDDDLFLNPNHQVAAESGGESENDSSD